MAVHNGQVLDVDVSQFQSIHYSVYPPVGAQCLGELHAGYR